MAGRASYREAALRHCVTNVTATRADAPIPRRPQQAPRWRAISRGLSPHPVPSDDISYRSAQKVIGCVFELGSECEITLIRIWYVPVLGSAALTVALDTAAGGASLIAGSATSLRSVPPVREDHLAELRRRD